MRTEAKIAKGFLLIRRYDDRNNIVGEREYLDRRCGVAWPTIHGVGYACVFGLYNESKPRRMRLLWEYRNDDRAKLIDKTVTNCRKFGVKWAFADLQNEFETNQYAWWNHCKKLKVDDLQIHDTHDIGGVQNARGSIDDMTKRGLLRIPKKSIVFREGMRLSPEMMRSVDHVLPHEQFPAMHALSNIVASYDWYPYRKRKEVFGEKKQATGTRPGYG
jgi:hypothetical protein